MRYTIERNGQAYVSTDDALLAINLYSQLVQSGQKKILLLDGKKVFSSTDDLVSIKSVNHGK